MRMAKRAILRLALVGWLGLSGFSGLTANLAQAATPPEQVLPDSTVFLVKVADINALRESFRQSQYGQLWNDPALKDFRDDIAGKLKRSASRSGSCLTFPRDTWRLPLSARMTQNYL